MIIMRRERTLLRKYEYPSVLFAILDWIYIKWASYQDISYNQFFVNTIGAYGEAISCDYSA
jgi:hypothetical protein